MNFSRFEPFKVLAYYPKLKELSRGNFVDPVQWIVYPSHRCMLDCGHCIMCDLRKDNVVLPKETLDKMVKDCIRTGVKSVLVSGGGEPLTNPWILETMQKLRDAGIEVALNTNGIMLPTVIPADYVRVSVDAASAIGYKQVHGYDGWARLNENLRKLSGYKELGLAFLLRHDNAGELLPFLDWCQQFPYTFLHVRPAYWPMYEDLIMEETQKVLRVRDDLQNKYRNLTISADKFAGTWTPKQFSKCRASGLKAVLAADGSFIVCQDVFSKFGDYNRKTFEECWYSDDHRRAIERVNISNCPRCVEVDKNEIIEHCVCGDGLKLGLI